MSKTKEIIFDFRNNKNVKSPVCINDSNVDIVKSYKYLGLTIQDNLKWDIHVQNQVKKANKRMYHVRCLRKLHVDHKIICLFYNSVVSSVLMYAISSWFGRCCNKLKSKVQKFQKKMSKIVSPSCYDTIESHVAVYEKKCMSLTVKILNDNDHPLSIYINRLPHGKRLFMISTTLARFRETFVPCSIKLYNNTMS